MSDTEVTLSSLTSNTYLEEKGCRCRAQDCGVVTLWIVSLFVFLAGARAGITYRRRGAVAPTPRGGRGDPRRRLISSARDPVETT